MHSMSTPPHTGEDEPTRPEGLPAALGRALRDGVREVAATRAGTASTTIADGSRRVLPTQLIIEPASSSASTDDAAAAVLDFLQGR